MRLHLSDDQPPAITPKRAPPGGAKDRIKLYYTEGSWLHIDEGELVEEARKAKERGFGGTKIKVGRPHVAEDVRRLRAVRKAVGDDFDVMTDANQGFMVDEAIRRARHYEECDIAWFEEPIHADDVMAYKRLCESTQIPIAVGDPRDLLGATVEREHGDPRTISIKIPQNHWLKTTAAPALSTRHGRPGSGSGTSAFGFLAREQTIPALPRITVAELTIYLRFRPKMGNSPLRET